MILTPKAAGEKAMEIFDKKYPDKNDPKGFLAAFNGDPYRLVFKILENQEELLSQELTKEIFVDGGKKFFEGFEQNFTITKGCGITIQFYNYIVRITFDNPALRCIKIKDCSVGDFLRAIEKHNKNNEPIKLKFTESYNKQLIK